MFRTNRYHFKVSNILGSVEGAVNLIVQDDQEQGEQDPKLSFESHPVTHNEFGDYVASSHSHNDSTFVLQFQVGFVATELC